MSRLSLSSASALAAIALTTFLSSTVPAQAAIQGTVIIQSSPQLAYRNVPPPPPRVVNRPGARRGHVWVEGHWEWRGARYRWVNGYWLQARRGYAYRQPQWVQHHGRWTYVRGDWRRSNGQQLHDRDRDGDGVRNRRDRSPDNPRRH